MRKKGYLQKIISAALVTITAFIFVLVNTQIVSAESDDPQWQQFKNWFKNQFESGNNTVLLDYMFDSFSFTTYIADPQELQEYIDGLQEAIDSNDLEFYDYMLGGQADYFIYSLNDEQREFLISKYGMDMNSGGDTGNEGEGGDNIIIDLEQVETFLTELQEIVIEARDLLNGIFNTIIVFVAMFLVWAICRTIAYTLSAYL